MSFVRLDGRAIELQRVMPQYWSLCDDSHRWRRDGASAASTRSVWSTHCAGQRGPGKSSSNTRPQDATEGFSTATLGSTRSTLRYSPTAIACVSSLPRSDHTCGSGRPRCRVPTPILVSIGNPTGLSYGQLPRSPMRLVPFRLLEGATLRKGTAKGQWRVERGDVELNDDFEVSMYST